MYGKKDRRQAAGLWKDVGMDLAFQIWRCAIILIILTLISGLFACLATNTQKMVGVGRISVLEGENYY